MIIPACPSPKHSYIPATGETVTNLSRVDTGAQFWFVEEKKIKKTIQSNNKEADETQTGEGNTSCWDCLLINSVLYV